MASKTLRTLSSERPPFLNVWTYLRISQAFCLFNSAHNTLRSTQSWFRSQSLTARIEVGSQNGGAPAESRVHILSILLTLLKPSEKPPAYSGLEDHGRNTRAQF